MVGQNIEEMNRQNITKFEFVCKACKSQGEESQVQLHVDFKKKYYLLICYGCGSTESFNEDNKRIEKEEGGGSTGSMPSTSN